MNMFAELYAKENEQSGVKGFVQQPLLTQREVVHHASSVAIPEVPSNNMFADMHRQEQQGAIPLPGALPEPETGRTVGNVLNDAAVTLGKGLIGIDEAAIGLVDLVTPGQFGKWVEDKTKGTLLDIDNAKRVADSMYSKPQQEAQRKVAEADGVLNTLKAAAQYPSTILTAVGESLPSVFAAGVVGRSLAFLPKSSKLIGLAQKVLGPNASAILRGAAGEGVVSAGSAAEAIRNESDGQTTGKQDLLAAASGAGTALFGVLGGRIATKLGIGDPDLMAAGGNVVEAATKKGIPRQVVEGFIVESLFEEIPQSVQEQMLQNLATGKELFADVDQAAVMGGLAGGVMGAGASGLHAVGNRGKVKTDIDMTKPQDDSAASEQDNGTIRPPSEPVVAEAVKNGKVTESPQVDLDMTGNATEPETLIEDDAIGLSKVGETSNEAPESTNLHSLWQKMHEEAIASGQEFPGPPKDGSNFGEVMPATADVNNGAGAFTESNFGLSEYKDASEQDQSIDLIQTAADQAANSLNNDRPESTEAQNAKGNYKKGPVPRDATPLGVEMMIENPAGSKRSGTAEDGTTWEQEMQHHYGYIKGIEGFDKDKLDVFFGPNADTSDTVHVVDQYNQAGEFDEHKVILGAVSDEDAHDIYHANYQDGWDGAGAVTEMSADEFKRWAKAGGPKKGALVPMERENPETGAGPEPPLSVAGLQTSFERVPDDIEIETEVTGTKGTVATVRISGKRAIRSLKETLTMLNNTIDCVKS